MRDYSLIKTLWFNYRYFPREIARIRPVKVGRRVDIKGLVPARRCRPGRKSRHQHEPGLIFREGTEIHRYMCRIGCGSWQLYSNRSMRTFLWLTSRSRLILGDETDFCTGSRTVVTSHGVLEIGDRFFLNQNSLLWCSRSIRIGSDVSIGWDSQVYDTDFHVWRSGGVPLPDTSPVVIGDRVLVANRCTVAKGSVIPAGATVASNSLVNRDLTAPENTLFAGTPARAVRGDYVRVLDKKEEAHLRKQMLRDVPPAGPLNP